MQEELKPKEEKRDNWKATRDYLDGLPSNELQKVVMNLQEEMKRLQIENLVFEDFLHSHEASLISGMTRTLQLLLEYQDHFFSNTSIRSSTTVISEGRFGDSQSIASGTFSLLGKRLATMRAKGPRINFTQKTDLVLREIDDLQVDLKKLLEYTHRQKNRLKAELEEYGIRNTELTEAAQNFETQIVIEAVEKITQKIPAEKFVRYMQEWLKSAQIMLEKLRLRTNSLCAQEKRLKAQLREKEDLGECVHEVDFEKLGIENKNFLISIDIKNGNLLELKQMNGKANLLLATHKSFLQKQEEYLKKLQAQRTDVNRETTDLSQLLEDTQKDIDQDRRKYDRMKMTMKKYQVPDVMEYILKKTELDDCKKQMKVWKRKVNIQTIMMQTYTKIMCHITNSLKSKPEWFKRKMVSWHDDDESDCTDEDNKEYFAVVRRQNPKASHQKLGLNLSIVKQ